MAEHATADEFDRFAEHERWVREVRDPAKLSSEGLRVINACDGKATAEYEIAPLPSGRYALRFVLSYHCGNGSGHAVPWVEFASREKCVDIFLEAARRHFQPECRDSNCNDLQKAARTQMLQLLNGGLFGFIEPEPQPPENRQ